MIKNNNNSLDKFRFLSRSEPAAKALLSCLRTPLIGQLLLLFLLIFSPLATTSVWAVTVLTVEAVTWDVIGLDSNNVNVGPNEFPVGAKICNDGSEPATGVQATMVWTSSSSYIDFSPGTLSTQRCPVQFARQYSKCPL